jgi:hypothetical protein
VKRVPHDPSGFDCMDCHLTYPWIASADERVNWHLCRVCLSKRPSSRRVKVKQAEKRRRCSLCRSYITVSQYGSLCHACNRERNLDALKSGRETIHRNAILRRQGIEPPPPRRAGAKK